eukprot:scpid22923/ scgid4518/ Tubulin polyglutamylase TTLL4; Tubulin--tyrosine ligase-like protein 4
MASACVITDTRHTTTLGSISQHSPAAQQHRATVASSTLPSRFDAPPNGSTLESHELGVPTRADNARTLDDDYNSGVDYESSVADDDGEDFTDPDEDGDDLTSNGNASACSLDITDDSLANAISELTLPGESAPRPTRTQGLSTQAVSTESGSAANTTTAATAAAEAAGPLSKVEPLHSSLFAHCNPAIYFPSAAEELSHTLPTCVRSMLKWRMSTITPIAIRQLLKRACFKPTTKNADWLGFWGGHIKTMAFRRLHDHQKTNHFPGTFCIGRKDYLWTRLLHMQLRFGKKNFDFFPQTFILPRDTVHLRQQWDDSGKQKWIVKPPASARGIGIHLINKWAQVPRRRSVVVQRYLDKPYLINESKFDLRVYVYVPSYDPLRIYVYEDGLVRFATCKYKNSSKHIANRFMHLTNYSVNKKNTTFTANSDETVCQGHKWGLKALWRYLDERGEDSDTVWASIIDVVIKTIIASESTVNSKIKANVRRRSCVHELFGFDIFLTDQLKPYVLEVNISPSLHTSSQLDMNIKGGMLHDLLLMANFQLPCEAGTPAAEEMKRLGFPEDWRTCPPAGVQMQSDEKTKHACYANCHTVRDVRDTILDGLTPDDVRMLIESEDEFNRRGGFQRVFPTSDTDAYEPFFDIPRYYNMLLSEWIQRYRSAPQLGISYLQEQAHKRMHLKTARKLEEQWRPPEKAKQLTFPSGRLRGPLSALAPPPPPPAPLQRSKSSPAPAPPPLKDNSKPSTHHFSRRGPTGSATSSLVSVKSASSSLAASRTQQASKTKPRLSKGATVDKHKPVGRARAGSLPSPRLRRRQCSHGCAEAVCGCGCGVPRIRTFAVPYPLPVESSGMVCENTGDAHHHQQHHHQYQHHEQQHHHQHAYCVDHPSSHNSLASFASNDSGVDDLSQTSVISSTVGSAAMVTSSTAVVADALSRTTTTTTAAGNSPVRIGSFSKTAPSSATNSSSAIAKSHTKASKSSSTRQAQKPASTGQRQPYALQPIRQDPVAAGAMLTGVPRASLATAHGRFVPMSSSTVEIMPLERGGAKPGSYRGDCPSVYSDSLTTTRTLQAASAVLALQQERTLPPPARALPKMTARQRSEPPLPTIRRGLPSQRRA